MSAAAFFSRTAGFSKAFFREIPLVGCGRRKKWLACCKARALVRIPEQVQQPAPLLRKLVRKAAQDALLFRRDMLQAQRGRRKCLIR